MAKLSAVDKAIARLQDEIGDHQRQIAVLEHAIKALKDEKPTKRPRVVKTEQVS